MQSLSAGIFRAGISINNPLKFRFARDRWSKVIRLNQTTIEYAPPKLKNVLQHVPLNLSLQPTE